jgi:hypothetical protein
MTAEQLISERIKALHPTCLIRDLRIEEAEEEDFRVSYIKVRKDDTWVRCTLHIVVDKPEPDELTYWDGDETDRIQY